MAKDWSVRREMKRIDFKEAFGSDVDQLDPQPRTSREMEVKRLGHLLNEGYDETRPPRRELAVRVNEVRSVDPTTGWPRGAGETGPSRCNPHSASCASSSFRGA